MIIVSASHNYNGQDNEAMKGFLFDDLPENYQKDLLSIHSQGEDQVRAMFNPNLDYKITLTDSDLAQINAKTLIIHGDRDALIPLEKATNMHQFLPNSSLWVVPNSGHVPISDKNLNLFNSVVTEFLNQK